MTYENSSKKDNVQSGFNEITQLARQAQKDDFKLAYIKLEQGIDTRDWGKVEKALESFRWYGYAVGYLTYHIPVVRPKAVAKLASVFNINAEAFLLALS